MIRTGLDRLPAAIQRGKGDASDGQAADVAGNKVSDPVPHTLLLASTRANASLPSSVLGKRGGVFREQT